MALPLFNEIITAVIDHDPFFRNNIDCTGKVGISRLLKCTSSIHQLAYGVHAEFLDEYIGSVVRTHLKRNMLDVIMVRIRSFCLKLLRRKTCGYDMLSSVLLGSNNDINVLYQSPLFNDLKTGRAPEIPFEANSVTYRSGYYLVDGIYPELVPLVKTIAEPADDDHKRILYKQKHNQQGKMSNERLVF
ncbi:ALP1-like protein isoform X1 [Tanacetum coccineum]